MPSKPPSAVDPVRITIELPPDIADLLGSAPAAVGGELMQLALIELYRRGDISTGYAAQILGISRWEFIRLLGKHGVGYFETTEEELRQQFEEAKPHRLRQKTSPSPTQAP